MRISFLTSPKPHRSPLRTIRWLFAPEFRTPNTANAQRSVRWYDQLMWSNRTKSLSTSEHTNYRRSVSKAFQIRWPLSCFCLFFEVSAKLLLICSWVCQVWAVAPPNDFAFWKSLPYFRENYLRNFRGKPFPPFRHRVRKACRFRLWTDHWKWSLASSEAAPRADDLDNS